MGKRRVKVIKLGPQHLKGWLTRSVFTPSMEKVMEKWVRKGYKLESQETITDRKGKVKNVLLTFVKYK